MLRGGDQHGLDQTKIIHEQQKNKDKQKDLKPAFCRQLIPLNGQKQHQCIGPIGGIQEQILAIAHVKQKIKEQDRQKGKREALILPLEAFQKKKPAQQTQTSPCHGQQCTKASLIFAQAHGIGLE